MCGRPCHVLLSEPHSPTVCTLNRHPRKSLNASADQGLHVFVVSFLHICTLHFQLVLGHFSSSQVQMSGVTIPTHSSYPLPTTSTLHNPTLCLCSRGGGILPKNKALDAHPFFPASFSSCCYWACSQACT